MHLFYEINSWAGRIEWLDASLRFFYVSVTPFLATLLAALICLRPQRESILMVRRGIILSSLLSLALNISVVLAINFFQQSVLGGAPISPRPFMTHWVNALVVEPNGNSFPCFEVMFASAFAMLIWAKRPRWALLAWPLALLLGFARIYCGSNYPGDVLAGLATGAALSTLALALCRVTLPLGDETWQWRWNWNPVRQGAGAAATLAILFLAGIYWLWNAPAHSNKLRASFANANIVQSPATAAPPTKAVRTASLTGNIHEGEGGSASSGLAAMGAPGEPLLSTRAARMDGHLPEAEKLLLQALEAKELRHRILGVNVAEVTAGTTGFRCAAVRFEVTQSGVDERERVAETAAQIVKTAFHADGQLQHVDVLGVKVGEPSMLKQAALSAAPAHAEKPVFTASVERQNLIIRQPNKPKWVNDPNLEGGLWLRARSLLYIDQQALPALPEKVLSEPVPVAEPNPEPTATPIPQVRIVKPRSIPKIKRSAVASRPKAVVGKKIVTHTTVVRKAAVRKTKPALRRVAPRRVEAAPVRKKRVLRKSSRRRSRVGRSVRWRIRRDRNGRRYKVYVR